MCITFMLSSTDYWLCHDKICQIGSWNSQFHIKNIFQIVLYLFVFEYTDVHRISFIVHYGEGGGATKREGGGGM